MKKVSRKSKRRMGLLTCLLIAVIVLLGTSFFSNWSSIMKNKREVQALNEKYNDLLDEESSLKSEVAKLQDPDYVARYAREKYLYSKSGEIIIRIPENNNKEQ